MKNVSPENWIRCTGQVRKMPLVVSLREDSDNSDSDSE